MVNDHPHVNLYKMDQPTMESLEDSCLNESLLAYQPIAEVGRVELLLMLEEQTKLHQPYWKPALNDTIEEYCSECNKRYPCPTKRILEQGEQ